MQRGNLGGSKRLDPRGLDAEPLAGLARLIERTPGGQATRESGAPRRSRSTQTRPTYPVPFTPDIRRMRVTTV